MQIFLSRCSGPLFTRILAYDLSILPIHLRSYEAQTAILLHTLTGGDMYLLYYWKHNVRLCHMF